MIKLLFGKYQHQQKDIRHNLVRLALVCIFSLEIFMNYSNLQDRTILVVRDYPPFEPPCAKRKIEVFKYLVSKRMEVEFEASKNANSEWINDCRLLEQLCRGAYRCRNGETIHSLLIRLFQRYDYQIHTRFKFYGGRSALAYAGLFGQVEVVRILMEQCCGNIDKLDDVSSLSIFVFYLLGGI